MAVAMDNAILENILRQVRRDFPGAQYPERIIQFGEGNFLRAFVDWQIDLLNEHTDLNSGVVVVRPIETSNSGASIGTQELVAIVLAEKDHWEQDLTQVPGLVEQVANDLDAILEKGMREAVRPLC